MIKNIFKNKQSGFTLIEAIIYIGIFSFIMSGALISIYGIIGSSARNSSKAMIEEEGSFIIGKIDYILNNAPSVSVTNSGATLTTGAGASAIVTSIASGNISIKRGASAVQNLNNSNTTITCPTLGCFVYSAGSGEGINYESISVDVIVNTLTSEGLSYSQEFSTIKYLRK